ncbi:hypothetical protein [Citreimonas salinaria]|uniref:hypothetical protein n=1 Tax=Citreimonas salinaria TaxID=321339 RepID=UPI001C4323F6|nr:hypothetical protein [Citreimonas salinaria]
MLQTEEGAAADDQKYVAAEANTPQREAKAFECDAGAATSSEASGKKNEEAATAGGRHG